MSLNLYDYAIQNNKEYLITEWSDKNTEDIHKIEHTSTKRVIWKCENCGRERSVGIASRIRHAGVCHSCSGYLNQQFTDRKKISEVPELLSEWSPDNSFQPEDVCAHSGMDIKWVCSKCGYEWTEKPYRIMERKGTSCPACREKNRNERAALKNKPATEEKARKRAYQRSSVSLYDYAIQNNKDYLISEWSEKNTTDIHKIAHCSREKGIWKCEHCGREWEATIASRVYEGTRCQKCVKYYHQKVTEDDKLVPYRKYDGRIKVSDVPELLNIWSPDNSFRPEDVCARSGMDIRWVCSKCGHEWIETPYRVLGAKGTPCPACRAENRKGKAALHRKPSAESKHDQPYQHRTKISDVPELLAEWSPENTVNPENVCIKSGKQYIWRCRKCGHEWTDSPNYRYQRHYKCPNCRAEKIDHEKAAAISEISLFFDADANDIALNDINIKDNSTTVYWKCSKGHVWGEPAGSMSKRGGKCPVCSGELPIFAAKYEESPNKETADRSFSIYLNRSGK